MKRRFTLFILLAVAMLHFCSCYVTYHDDAGKYRQGYHHYHHREHRH